MTAMNDPRVVLITHPREGAEAFARLLVDRRLAACVNLLDARSVYRWEGEIACEDEALLVVKTVLPRFEALQAALLADHPYDTPECVALTPEAIEPRYRAWLVDACAPTEAEG